MYLVILITDPKLPKILFGDYLIGNSANFSQNFIQNLKLYMKFPHILLKILLVIYRKFPQK